MIVAGQVHGGLAQGIGQALLEGCVYDKETGQLLTGSYNDYAMPRADDLPAFALSTNVTLCTHNPLGVKGCGEAGAIGAPAAIANAIVDALKPLGRSPCRHAGDPRKTVARDPDSTASRAPRNEESVPSIRSQRNRPSSWPGSSAAMSRLPAQAEQGFVDARNKSGAYGQPGNSGEARCTNSPTTSPRASTRSRLSSAPTRRPSSSPAA